MDNSLEFQVLTVTAWGQRREPEVGTLVGLTDNLGTIAWITARAGVTYHKTGFYLGHRQVLVAKVGAAEDQL